jgi:hypothetical protein
VRFDRDLGALKPLAFITRMGSSPSGISGRASRDNAWIFISRDIETHPLGCSPCDNANAVARS